MPLSYPAATTVRNRAPSGRALKPLFMSRSQDFLDKIVLDNAMKVAIRKPFGGV
jgi:hypothetical protein